MKRILEFGLLLALGLVGGFLAAMPVQAFEDDGSWQEANYWYIEGFNQGSGPTKSAACKNAASSIGKTGSMDDGQCRIEPFGYFPKSNRCSSVVGHSHEPNSGCGTAPGPDCPGVGEKKRLGYTKTTTPGSYDGGLVITITNGASQGASIVSGGCGYSRVPSSIPDCKLYAYDSEGRYKWNCYADYEATGEAADPDPASSLEYFDESDDEAPNEADGVKDTRQSSVSKTSTDPVTEMVGTKKVTRKTDITTETRGDGAVVEKQDDTTIITESNGITKTETKTTTTTTEADGSQTVETTNNISYTQHPQVIYNIDNSENRITVSGAPGGTTSQTVTTKDTYDAEGNQTGSEKNTGPVQGDDAGKQSEQKQTCENNPLMDKCIDQFKKTAQGEFGDIAEKITKAKTDFESKWEAIKSEASGKLGFTLSGGGALEQSLVTIRGIEADIGITRWTPYLDEFGLAALIMAAAALYSAVVMFKG